MRFSPISTLPMEAHTPGGAPSSLSFRACLFRDFSVLSHSAKAVSERLEGTVCFAASAKPAAMPRTREQFDQRGMLRVEAEIAMFRRRVSSVDDVVFIPANLHCRRFPRAGERSPAGSSGKPGFTHGCASHRGVCRGGARDKFKKPSAIPERPRRGRREP